MRYAAAENQEMDAPFNNNLPTPFNDVIVNPGNPVNPDSKPVAAARRISIDGRVYVPDVFSRVRYEKCENVCVENRKIVTLTNS
jgi:hypothetical protein